MGLQGGNTAVAQFDDGVTQCFGTGDVLCTVWDVTDPDANLYMVEVPTGGVVDVPVVVVGQAIIGVNLALFDGLLQPEFAVLDSDRDSYISLGAAGDDLPAIFAKVGAGVRLERFRFNATGMVINEAGVDLDFRIELGGNPNGIIMDAGLESMGIGGTVRAETRLNVGFPSLIVTVDASGAAIHVAPNLTEAASGTHAEMIGVDIEALVLTGAGGATTRAATVRIRGAPTGGSVNLALDVQGNTVVNGQLLVGIDASPNNLSGLTIQMGADDGEIITLKSTDVAHGLTGVTETDVFGRLNKASSALGGFGITGLTEVTGTSGLLLDSRYGADNTAKSAASLGALELRVAKHDGVGGGSSPAAGQNLVVVSDTFAGAAKWLVDQEGDAHYDGTTNATAWDEYDDIALLTAARGVLMPVRSEMRERFGEWIEQYKQVLHETGVITINEDGHHFVSTKGLNALFMDTFRQVGDRLGALESETKPLGGPSKWSRFMNKILR